jgi:hypothetical protein
VKWPCDPALCRIPLHHEEGSEDEEVEERGGGRGGEFILYISLRYTYRLYVCMQVGIRACMYVCVCVCARACKRAYTVGHAKKSHGQSYQHDEHYASDDTL